MVEVFLLPGSNKPDKTKVIKSTTDPVFNDNFQFQANFQICYVCCLVMFKAPCLDPSKCGQLEDSAAAGV